MTRVNTAKLTSAWLALLLLCCTISVGTLALPEDRDQPIHVASDSAKRDDKQGITIYEGNVEITQGTLKILADKVTIYSTGEGVSKMIAEGKPAHYQQIPEPAKPLVIARATTIQYYVDQEKIKLLKNAFLEQESSTLKGEKIDYNIATAVVNASSKPGTTDDRVKMVIQPSKKQP